MNKVTTISHRILQVHCQSRTSQRFNQSFVKDLAKPMHNRLTEKTKEEHRTDNSGFAKKRVQWLIEHSTSHQILCYVDSFELRNPLLRKAAERYLSFPKNSMTIQKNINNFVDNYPRGINV